MERGIVDDLDRIGRKKNAALLEWLRREGLDDYQIMSTTIGWACETPVKWVDIQLLAPAQSVALMPVREVSRIGIIQGRTRTEATGKLYRTEFLCYVWHLVWRWGAAAILVSNWIETWI